MGKNKPAYDLEVYDYDFLSENDKTSVDAMEKVREDALGDDVIADFVESKSFSGRTLQNIYKEVLVDFIDFLRERVEYCKCDFIIDAIDGYSDEEFAKYSNGAKKPVPENER